MDKLVLVDDNPCSLEIVRFSVSQQINHIPAVTVELALPGTGSQSRHKEAMTEVSRYQPGQRFSLRLDGKPLFTGYLVRKQLRLQGNTGAMTLEARHGLQQLLIPPRSQVFRQQSDATILTGLLNRAGIRVDLPGTLLAQRHPQMVQFRSSDWNFIRSRLFAYNCWLLPAADSNRVTIQPLVTPSSEATPLRNKSGPAERTLYEVNINFDNRFTLDEVEMSGWDMVQQHLSDSQKNHASSFFPWQDPQHSDVSAGPLSRRQWQQTFSYLPETVLKELAQSCFNYRQLTAVQGTVVLKGTRDFHCGEKVALSDFGGGMDGTAILTGTEQMFDKERGWRTKLIFGLPNDIADLIPPIQGLHIGIVAGFSEDPEHLDRIPVHLPAFASPQEVIYARQGKPYASKESGFCFYPEPGDEVIIGFVECDPRYPIILGAMHNPKNSAPVRPDRANNQKVIRFTHDNVVAQILFDSQTGSITLSQGQNQLELNNKDNKFVVSASKVELTGSEEVEISGNKINMKKK